MMPLQTTATAPGRRLPALAAALLVVIAAGPGIAEASRIYRTVDEHGNVVFTDVPPKAGEQGREVDLNQGSTYQAPPVEAPPGRTMESWLGEDGSEDQAEASTRYSTLTVATPEHDAALRDNAGNVMVVAEVEPGLQPGHIMQVYLDGELQQSGTTPSFHLVNVDRGTHSVELRIVDGRGETLARSEPSVFHLQRRSVILQPAGGKRAN